ncbi:elongation of very long chain fatty acids protein 4-like [Gigantopelta aegis]|uniref:elongation of very long chain fatty acids protein 4-like n=1 Tax=Gigantopelta aegis TaxID=1735272 RepID=UPI001B887F23|nr:elongation of very long chain fatty acids protein 4-like [Gigantopelta aegis]XP_041363778.1 elongation of very long chain fatty acids protein 4-like [Gigantopelta aegis]XP_041363780.1 elongation of very long chain fatty acids protein 4-like [Gigantopelta aegis]
MAGVLLEKLMRGFLLISGLPSFPIFCVYLLIILQSHWWQKHTRPLNLKLILIFYNFTCCSVNAVVMFGFCKGLYQSESIFQKQNSAQLKIYFCIYWITKVFELLDTIFMIVRHKRRQITFLHVYHHASMLLLSDLGYRLYSWPAIALFLSINAFVHVVLYLYYGLCAVSPENPPTWKKQLTQLQIVQFFTDFVFAAVGYVSHGFCIYGIFYGLTMMYLFCNFYYHAYVKKKKSEPVIKKLD